MALVADSVLLGLDRRFHGFIVPSGMRMLTTVGLVANGTSGIEYSGILWDCN